MSDYRIVQCEGVYKKPGKQARFCTLVWRWTAPGATKYRFGSKGISNCPKCGTAPNFKSPINRFLNGEIEETEYVKLIQDSFSEKD